MLASIAHSRAAALLRAVGAGRVDADRGPRRARPRRHPVRHRRLVDDGTAARRGSRRATRRTATSTRRCTRRCTSRRCSSGPTSSTSSATSSTSCRWPSAGSSAPLSSRRSTASRPSGSCPSIRAYDDIAHYVSISDADRHPDLTYAATIHHGIDARAVHARRGRRRLPAVPRPDPSRQGHARRDRGRATGGAAARDRRRRARRGLLPRLRSSRTSTATPSATSARSGPASATGCSAALRRCCTSSTSTSRSASRSSSRWRRHAGDRLPAGLDARARRDGVTGFLVADAEAAVDGRGAARRRPRPRACRIRRGPAVLGRADGRRLRAPLRRRGVGRDQRAAGVTPSATVSSSTVAGRRGGRRTARAPGPCGSGPSARARRASAATSSRRPWCSSHERRVSTSRSAVSRAQRRPAARATRRAQVGERRAVGAEHELGEVRRRCRRRRGPRARAARVRSARSYDARDLQSTAAPGRRRRRDRRSARSRRVRARPPASGTSSSTRSSSSLEAGQVLARERPCRPAARGAAPCTCAPGRTTAVRVVGGCQSARAAAAEVRSLVGAPESSRWARRSR